MNFFSVLTMIGGLALFLYGMNTMGDGLSKISGGKLESLLEKLTANKWKAVLLGAGVTAVIQSSSATTVMVVGFVNSGIMKLTQAVGVIMGANIGTTVTSWILSLAGIESENFFIQLLKPTSFSPVLALIGVGFLMFSKKEKKRDIGAVLLGFAVLMFGMNTMSEAIKPLAEVPEFMGILTTFSNPILGMIAGAVFTAIIQSSSASVGILQALCLTGSLNYVTALPIIMGQNIGTCVTALLSSIGTGKNARRAALVHFYFNLIGTSAFMILFYGINFLRPFDFLVTAASPLGVAIIHSVFNIFATMLLLPFSKFLEKLAYATIKETPEEKIQVVDDFQVLDAHFLNQPALAMEQCRTVTRKMAELSHEALRTSIALIGTYIPEEAEKVLQIEAKIDRYEDELGKYLLQISSKNLSVRDSQTLSELLHCIGDFERISDHSVNICEAAEEMFKKNLRFSPIAAEEFIVFSKAIDEIVSSAIHVFMTDDIEGAKAIEPLEEVIDNLNAKVKKRHIRRLRKGECTIEMGFILSDLSNCFERIADHCSNIAISVIQVVEDGVETHGYLETLEKGENTKFQELYNAYKQKYTLSGTGTSDDN
ncbi:MAG: Na/Pi cotransporter family protein [Lachnospiraceae bacterium]